MASSKKTAARKAPAAKTPAKSAAKKAAKPAKRGAGPGGHISQIDAGWFYIEQNGYQVGQVVVIGSQASSVEYYFLYAPGTSGSGKAPYTWPSASSTPVTSKYTYQAALPPNWSTPAKYKDSLWPVIAKLVTANCTMSATPNKKPSKKR